MILSYFFVLTLIYVLPKIFTQAFIVEYDGISFFTSFSIPNINFLLCEIDIRN